MTVTLNLPDDLAAQLAARPDADAFVAAAVADALDAEANASVDGEYDHDAAVEGIRRGFVALDAGNVTSLDDFVAEREQARRQRDAAATQSAGR